MEKTEINKSIIIIKMTIILFRLLLFLTLFPSRKSLIFKLYLSHISFNTFISGRFLPFSHFETA